MSTITLGQLRAIVAAEPATNDTLEVVVWLPGSRIALEPTFMATRDKSGALMIEGNVRAGSALMPVSDVDIATGRRRKDAR